MRPSPSSPLGPISEAPDRKRVTLAGAASRDSRASREDHAGRNIEFCASLVPSDLPAWAVTPTAPGRRAGSRGRDGVNVPDLEDEGADEGSVADARRTLSKKRGAGACVNRLVPLFTIAEAAGILNVSQRTVRRLIGTRAIGVVRIGRSVRIRRTEIEILVARGGTRR
jgi:excisionase family DNA binding protein